LPEAATETSSATEKTTLEVWERPSLLAMMTARRESGSPIGLETARTTAEKTSSVSRLPTKMEVLA
jgi:hypothetical protein